MTPTSHVAVLPAAGSGTRLGLGRAGAKEMVPVGPRGSRRRPVIEWALRRAHAAGVRDAVVVTTEEKEGLRSTLESLAADAETPRVDLLSTPPTPSSVHTVAAALERNLDADWLLVYPDILTAPASAPTRLVEHARRSPADVCLALFPSDRPDKVDMVEIDDRGRLRNLLIKRPATDLRFTWAYACWRPTFSAFVLQALSRPRDLDLQRRELFFGDVLLDALEEGLSIDTVAFEDGLALDIGTPADLRRAREAPDRRLFD